MTFNDPKRFYFIWQGNGFVDGEAFADDEAGRKALFLTIANLGEQRVNFRRPEFKVFSMQMDEGTLRDVTEDMVRDAFDAGYIEAEDSLYDAYCQGMRHETTASLRAELGTW